MKDYYTVKEYAKILNVHPQTLRRYTRLGLIKCTRTLGNHRRFVLSKDTPKDKGLVVGYVRVSSHDQKKDLESQEKAVEHKAASKGIIINKIIKDIGSGLNYNKRGFKQLLDLILNNKVKTLVLNHKDRLLRFGSEIIFSMCRYMNTEVVILEDNAHKQPIERLALDLVEIITVFSSKIYGMRSHKNKCSTLI